MDDGRCLHPEVSELETAPLRLTRVAVRAADAELWRCSICASWFVRVRTLRAEGRARAAKGRLSEPAEPEREDALLAVADPDGAGAFVKLFGAWIAGEAARRNVSPDEVRAEVLGPPPAPPRMVVRPPPPRDALQRAATMALRLVELGIVRRFAEDDLDELARVVAEPGPWSLPALLAALPEETLARRRVIAPARALGTVDPWDVAERVNEDTTGPDVSFVLVPAGDAGDLLPVGKANLPSLATWEGLRGEDRRRLARLASRVR